MIICVQHRRSGFRECLNEFTLRRGNALNSPYTLGVRLAHCGHDTDLRLSDLAQRTDLTKASHPHLEHQHLGVIGGVENRNRQALFIVKAALVRRCPKVGAAGGCDEVLCRGLTDTAGDPDDSCRRAIACSRGQRH